jgi:hypothetical protein
MLVSACSIKPTSTGTHTITPEANTIHHTTFAEWGERGNVVASGPIDQRQHVEYLAHEQDDRHDRDARTDG